MARRKAEEKARRDEEAQRQAEERRRKEEEEEKKAEEERLQNEREETMRLQKQVGAEKVCILRAVSWKQKTLWGTLCMSRKRRRSLDRGRKLSV